MSPEAFERIAADEFAHIPARIASRMHNVALLIEEEPSGEVRIAEGLAEGETLLGLYHGIPMSARGDQYSGVLPDTVTLYRRPLLEEASALLEEERAKDEAEAVRLAVRETLWHEIGHYYGLPEEAVHEREAAGTNDFSYAHHASPGTHSRGRSAIMEGTLHDADHFTRLTTPMAKRLALIFGIIFVLIGLLGFVSNPLVGAGALFAANAAHNMVHLLLGLILLAVSFWAPARAATWLKVVGGISIFMALLGFVTVSPLLGFIEANDADNWFHLVAGVVLFIAGM